MLQYFTYDGGQFFNRLQSDVLGRASLTRWQGLLEQCFDAYDRKHYLVPVPALLTVIEGLWREKLASSKPNKLAQRNSQQI